MIARAPGTAGPRLARGWRWLACGIIVGGLAAWAVFASTDMAAVVAMLAGGVDFAALAGALVAYGFYFLGKALRWRILLRPLIDLPLSGLTAYVLIGYAGNVVLPMQAGEVARGYLLSRHHGVRLPAVLSGIALEKALDFFALLLFLAWALVTLEVSSPLAERAAIVLAGLLVLASLILAAALARPEASAALIDRLMARGPAPIATRLRPVVHTALDGVAAVRHGHLLLQIVVSGLASWGAMLAALWLTLQAVQVDASLAGAVIVMTLAAIGLALPTSPGFVGTLQAAFVLGLVPMGVTQEAAVAASLLYQGFTTVPPLAAGALAWAGLRVQRSR